MTIYQCSVCDPNDPRILPRAGQLAKPETEINNILFDYVDVKP